MHAVVRTYTGPGATELMGRIEARREEVEALIRGVSGLVSYALIRTDYGGITVTICQDKGGTDESVRVAREWVGANASDLGVPSPEVSDGPTGIYLT